MIHRSILSFHIQSGIPRARATDSMDLDLFSSMGLVKAKKPSLQTAQNERTTLYHLKLVRLKG